MQDEKRDETKQPSTRRELWRGDKEKFWKHYKAVSDAIVEQCHRNLNPDLIDDDGK